MASFTGLDPYTLTDVTVTNDTVEQGAYAKVLHVDYLGLKCSGKRINTNVLNEGDLLARLKDECCLLSTIRHPNIVEFFGVFFQEGDGTPILLSELLPTTLTSCIESYGILPKEFSYSILHDVALGLSHLHSKTPPIVHGDLSSNSIVLTSTMTAKIADLGVARIVSYAQGSHMTKASSGTTAFMPPELLTGESSPDTSVDTFSYGVLTIHIFCGKWPEPQAPLEQSKKKSKKVAPPTEAKRREQYLQWIGKDHPLMALVHKCIDNDPQKRPDAKEILERSSEMVSKFPSSVPNPLDMLKILVGEGEEIKSLRQAAEEREKMIRKKEEQHKLEVEELQQYLERLRIPLTTIKQPLQANITWIQCQHPQPAIAPVQSTVINGKVYLGGGESEYVYCFNPSEEKWTHLPPLPVKEYGLGQLNGNLVAVGGIDHASQLPTNLLYSLVGTKSLKWERRLPPMPTARHSVAVVGLKSALLVAGGQVDSVKSTNAVEVFKTDTSRWYMTDSFQLPTACFYPSLSTLEDRLYVIGGYTNDISSRLSQAMYASISDILDFAEYDEIDGGIESHWKQLHKTPTYHPIGAILDGNVLAICGHDTPHTSTIGKKVYMYSPQINSWIYISDLPESLVCTTAITLSPTEILVMGSDADKATIVFKGSVTAEMNIRV